MVDARNIRSVVERVQRGFGVMIEVEIEMSDLADVVLGSAARFRMQSVHADVDLEALIVLAGEPFLDRFGTDLVNGSNPLDAGAGAPVEQKQR